MMTRLSGKKNGIGILSEDLNMISLASLRHLRAMKMARLHSHIIRSSRQRQIGVSATSKQDGGGCPLLEIGFHCHTISSRSYCGRVCPTNIAERCGGASWEGKLERLRLLLHTKIM